MSEVRRAGYVVRGRVQGVGFRWWTARTAARLAVAGTVRNRPDASVEVMAVGDASALDELEAELRRGPRVSRVDSVESIECTLPYGVSGFTILG